MKNAVLLVLVDITVRLSKINLAAKVLGLEFGAHDCGCVVKLVVAVMIDSSVSWTPRQRG